MRAPIALIGIIDIGVRIDMKYCQMAVTATHRTHDRMGDGMVAAEANQWIAGLHRVGHLLLDDIPWIGATVELDIAMVNESVPLGRPRRGEARSAE
jgi:hypothetical protein